MLKIAKATFVTPDKEMIQVLNRTVQFLCKTIIYSLIAIVPLERVLGQIIPDRSLGTKSSTVHNNVQGAINLIGGGTQRGINLFHSFQEFNVGVASTYFLNPSGVKNIISRVTGNHPTQILGRLGVLGTADLFIINQNGVYFGNGASLDLRGSFVATTAKSIEFSDFVFGTNNLTPIPFNSARTNPLSITFKDNYSNITIQGNGHILRIPDLDNPIFGSILVFGAGQSSSGLKTQSNNGIFIAGGNVNINGGIVSATGIIDISAVHTGQIPINRTSYGWQGDYSKVKEFGDVALDHFSLIDASGISSGSIYLSGRNISLRNASYVLNQNQGLGTSGEIRIAAFNNLSLSGFISAQATSNGDFALSKTAITSQGILGDSADIYIKTANLTLLNGGSIVTSTLGNGESGNISIDADTINIIGVSPLAPIDSPSAVTILAFGSSNAGYININTKNLNLSSSFGIGSLVSGTGGAGDININAESSIRIEGFDFFNRSSTSISTLSLSTGKLGRINIISPLIMISNSGSISSSTFGFGGAGDINIVSDYLYIDGDKSAVSSSVQALNPEFASLFSILPLTVADSGTIHIKSNQISLTNGASISVENQGAGFGGQISIDAKEISLNNSSILASTKSKSGGNIFINADKLLSLDSSRISASSDGNGTGGRIAINTGVLIGGRSSAVTANSQGNLGGTIQISADGVVAAPNFAVTATSALGSQFDGTISIDTSTTLPEIVSPINSAPLATEPVLSCGDISPLAFLGAGGSPMLLKDSFSPLDVLKPEPVQTSLYLTDRETGEKIPLIEPAGIRDNADGTVSFVANKADETLPATAQQPPCQSEHMASP